MRRNESPRRGEDERCVVVFLGFWRKFGNTTPDQIGLCFCGDRRESVEGRGLFFRGWRWEEGFRVLGEVLGAVWRVEALGENNQRGPSLCCFQYLGPGIGKVDSFISS